MTISTENRVAGPYAGTGVTSTYGFAFKVFSVSDLVVTKTVSSVDTTLVYGSDYSVSLNADQDANPGGTVTYCVSGTPTNLPVGTNLTITTAIPYTQGTQLTNGGGWYPKVVEYALDRIIAIVQQLKSIADRTLRLPLTVSGVSTSLPVPSAGKLIGWDSLGTSIENKDPASIASGVIYGTGKADLFDGNGVATAFTLSANPGAQANLDVAISGITQRPGIDFTWTTGTTLTFTSAPPAGTNNVLARYVQAVPTTGALQISANLSDVQDKPTARSNLGLASGATTVVGTAATQNVGTGANSVVQLDGSAKLPAVDGSQVTNIALAGRITASLGADVSLNNTANYFDGPSVAQGSTGTWFASGTVTLEDTAGGVRYLVKLHDGTTVIASTYVTISTASYPTPVTLSGYISAPAGNLRISVKDTTSTSGFIRANVSGNGKDSTITAIRIA